MSGTVESGPGFSWVDYFAKLNLPPTAGLVPAEGAIPSEWEASWISKSEQEKARDIFALMPAMPMMSFATFQTIAQNFPQLFSIANIGAAGGVGRGMGPSEAGLTLAAAYVWARQQNQESDLVRLLLASPDKNPLELALAQFVENAEIVPADAQDIQLALRRNAVLFAVLQTVNRPLIDKALAIAVQQIVLSLLDKWIDSLEKLAVAQREAAKQTDIRLQQASLQLLQTYFKRLMAKEEELSQPVLTIIIGSLLMSGLAVTGVSMISPFLPAITGVGTAIPLLSGVPPAVQALMGALSVGVVSAATTWATPVAMALVAASGGSISPNQVSTDSAKSFACSIASFIMNPALDKFMVGQLQEALASGQIDATVSNRVIAAFKVSLLMCAMAAVYKAETGGITGKELLELMKGIILHKRGEEPSQGEIMTLQDAELHKTLSTLVEVSTEFLSLEETEQLLTQLAQSYDKELELGTLTEPISSFLEVWSQNLGPEAATSTPA